MTQGYFQATYPPFLIMFYGLRYIQSVSGHTKVWRLWPPSTSGSMVALFLATSGTIQGRPESRDINGKALSFCRKSGVSRGNYRRLILASLSRLNLQSPLCLMGVLLHEQGLTRVTN